MNDIFTWIKLATAAILSAASYIFGGMDMIFKILIVFMAIDYITGVSAAVYTKKLSSRTGFNGILKKIAILCLIASAHMLGEVMGMEEIRSAVIGFYLANEGISIMENAARLGIPLPEKLVGILKQLKDKEEENDI